MLKKPRIFLQFILSIFIGCYVFSLVRYPVYSDQISDLEDQINQTNQEIQKKQGILASIEQRISEISNSNYTVSQKIALINTEISNLNKSISANESAINTKIKEIEEKQALLEAKKQSMDTLSSELYIQSRFRISTFFLSDEKWDDMIKDFFVKKNTISLLKDDVEKINGEFSNLTESKQQLEDQKAELEDEKQGLAQSYTLLAQEKAKLQAELSSQTSSKNSVSSSISNLMSQMSTLQKALITARLGGTVVNPDSVPSGSDLGSLSNFLSKASSGSFGVFSIGAYTNRNGMSQWGAKARAEAGQTYTQILKAYYPSTKIVTGYVEPMTIRVYGTGVDCSGNSKKYDETIPFSTYMKRIYEMPSSWKSEALKAQAVSARTYAIYKVKTQKYIIPNESNQVYKNCDNLSGWVNAVSSTQGIVMTSGGVVFASQYAAVSGGWVNNVGWDTTDGTANGDWMSRAWESISKVSWFYKIWYRTGYTSGTTVNADSCNRNPWLTQTEMADILNSYMLWKQIDLKGSVDMSRIYPIHDACHSSGNPYSYAEVKSLIKNPVTSISYAIASSSNGTTNSITFGTNRGVMIVNGNDFKYIYNLRAPGYLRIPQNNFVFINIQMK